MAENITQIEGVKISGLVEKTSLSGGELMVIADSRSNKKVAASTLKAYIGIVQEETARQQADTQLSNLIQDVDEERKAVEIALLTAAGDSDITVFDAGDYDLQQQLDGYDWDTIPHFLSGLSAEDMLDAGVIPLLIARDEKDNITECAIFKLPVEAATTTALHNLANYAPLSLASLYDMMQRKLTNSADVTIGGEQNNTLTLTDRARHAVFDDLWVAAGCTVGTGESKYLCNGIGHTYEEAKYLYDFGHPGHGKLLSFYRGSGIKTNLPERMNGNVEEGQLTYMGCASLTKVVAPLFIPGNGAFRDCTALQTISCYALTPERNAFADIYLNCSALTTIDFQTLWARDIDLSDSPLLDLATFQRIVSKYNKGTAITIYVHPDVYAKLTDIDQIVNAQWYAVMTQAVNKKIAFATKE
jgi:hypothetical protein